MMWVWTSWPKWLKWLISLPIVLGILAVFASIALVAMNPAGKVAQANNVQRKVDVETILNAVDQYIIDHKGAVPPGAPSEGNTLIMDSTNTGVAFCNALVPTYLPKLPQDPSAAGSGSNVDCNSYGTNYNITVSTGANGVPRVTVSAPDAELKEVISVSR